MSLVYSSSFYAFFVLLLLKVAQADPKSSIRRERKTGTTAGSTPNDDVKIAGEAERFVLSREDASSTPVLLSQRTKSGLIEAVVGSDLCPADAAAAATSFWKEHFDTHCHVDWDDVAKDLKDDIDKSTAFHPESDEKMHCLIVTPLSGMDGSIVFEVAKAEKSLPEDDWLPKENSAKRLFETEGYRKHEGSPCHIIGAGVPRMVDIPQQRVEEVFEQLRKDFDVECSPGESEISGLSLATVISESRVVGKKSMSDSSGKSLYSFSLSVDVAELDPITVQVYAEEDPLDDVKPEEAATLAFEEKMKEEAEAADRNETDLKSEIENSVDAKPSVDAPALMGKLRVLDGATQPRMCCLCGKCAKPEECSHGISEDRPLVDDEAGRIREQESRHPELVPDELLRYDTPTIYSEEETRPPPSAGHIPSPLDLRRRAAPEYGDNFQAVVMAKRTPDDHRRVWAQSRALIETARAEGLSVRKSYHFYDSEETGKCWRPAQNQGKCGSCWAFASLGALEKQICMRSRGSVSELLSREMLVRCSEQNGACEGGNADAAYEDLMEIGGVWKDDCLPYQSGPERQEPMSKHCPAFAYSWFGQGSVGKTGKFARIDQEIQKSCKDLTRFSNRPPQGPEWDMPFRMMYEARFGKSPDLKDEKLARFKRNFAKTRSRDKAAYWWLYGEEAMKVAINKYGSIYASYDAKPDFKSRQCEDGCWPPGTVWGEESGFLQSNCGCQSGHAVHIIGYDEETTEEGKKVPYWLIENSWGTEVHGDVHGNDYNVQVPLLGFKQDTGNDWGPDPFSTLHPLGIEEKCVLAGWAYSLLPTVGGCSGGEAVNVRKDVKMMCGEEKCKPDGMHLSAVVDGVEVGNWSLNPLQSIQFSKVLDMGPGSHTVTLRIYAKDHPKQQAFDVEEYGIQATSLRCRGRGFKYSFSKNDLKAKLSWNRKTRNELELEAKKLLPDVITKGKNDEKLSIYGNCPEKCRTGRYSWAKPCEGMLTRWGSCYTSSWAFKSSYILNSKVANCKPCESHQVYLDRKATAAQALDNATFLEWFKLVELARDAPGPPRWFRQNKKTCRVETAGWSSNARLSAAYSFDIEDRKFCDERHSAPFEMSKMKWFVHAPGRMEDGAKKSTRCPPPMLGSVELRCASGVLHHVKNTCAYRRTEMLASKGYFRMLRGKNYHRIESGPAFAIAEMNRFADHCPTFSWSRWTECSATAPCERGVQKRERSPIDLSKDDPKCAGISFTEERPCVGPGFCPDALTRFCGGCGPSIKNPRPTIATFLKEYKQRAYTITSGGLATAGSHMLESSTPTCQEAKYWCRMMTGKEQCNMLIDGHIEVKKTDNYRLFYTAEEGGGDLEFNALGEGNELKTQFRVVASKGSAGGMYEWQDFGFHHRRRRTDAAPWQRISSLELPRGTHYIRMMRSGWTRCPTYSLKLETLASSFKTPFLYGIDVGHKDGNQPTTTWNTNFGQGYAFGRRRRPTEDKGNLNELVLRDAFTWSRIYGKTEITKANYTADELYKLFGFKEHRVPHKYNVELVVRLSTMAPAAGEYVYKLSMDTSFDEKNKAWQSQSRRRQNALKIRAGGNEGRVAGFTKAAQSSVVKEVSWKTKEAGTVPFEAAILLPMDGHDNYVVMPNFLSVEMKKSDSLHGSSLNISSVTKYMSQLDAIRGDQLVRIEWPERDDPLSSELETQTFQALEPQALLIGKKNLAGFTATAEIVVDAGACVSVEAWLPTRDASVSFWGVGMNLCDVDGQNQYLELATYHPPDNKLQNVSQKQVAWTHAQFTHPTHVRIVRDPSNLTKFSFSFRPDDRELFAEPFEPVVVSGLAAKMEVGVSMNTAEAYRSAEFYNISIEDCPESCSDASGTQRMCGDVVTSCGNRLQCPTACGGHDVCQDNMCMKCPKLVLSEEEQKRECGSVTRTCVNHLDQKIQVDRAIGKKAPSEHHYCMDNKWVCVGDSKWSLFAEGKQCGHVKDVCGNMVELFGCPNENSRCEASENKCLCTPNNFSADFNCGSKYNGCGKATVFGPNDGECGDAAERCFENKCCTPKQLTDFPKYECGKESDTCGEELYGFRKHDVKPSSFVKHVPPTTEKDGLEKNTRYGCGVFGYELSAKKDMLVSSLGRGLSEKIGNEWKKLVDNRNVSLWRKDDEKLLGSVTVGPESTLSDGYAWAALETSLILKAGKEYRLVMQVIKGQEDMWDHKHRGNRDASYFKNGVMGQYASFRGSVYNYQSSNDCTYSTKYPSQKIYSGSSQKGLTAVNFRFDENDGCGPGSTCTAQHICKSSSFVEAPLMASAWVDPDGSVHNNSSAK